MESDGNIWEFFHTKLTIWSCTYTFGTFGRSRKVAGIVYSEVMIELHCAYWIRYVSIFYRIEECRVYMTLQKWILIVKVWVKYTFSKFTIISLAPVKDKGDIVQNVNFIFFLKYFNTFLPSTNVWRPYEARWESNYSFVEYRRNLTKIASSIAFQ